MVKTYFPEGVYPHFSRLAVQKINALTVQGFVEYGVAMRNFVDAKQYRAIVGAAGDVRWVEPCLTDPARDLQEMRVLVCSTRHVSAKESTDIHMDNLHVEVDGMPILLEPLKWQHGWIFHLGGDDEAVLSPELSEGFLGAVRIARSNGYEWLRFDTNGPVLPGVPTYSW
jgi:hypothetical protein